MTGFRLSLKEKKSPHGLERKPRYEVQVNGARVGELYYNMTGFRGALMDVQGRTVDIGERGISAWKSQAAWINRDARDLLARNAEDERELIDWRRTSRGDVFELTFHDKASGDRPGNYVHEDHLYAAMSLMDPEEISPSLFPEWQDPAPAPTRLAFPDAGDRVVKGFLQTADVNWNAVVVGEISEAAARDVKKDGLPAIGSLDQHAAAFMDWSNENDRVLFVRRGAMLETVAAHGTEVMPADALPKRGLTSQRGEVFAEPVTSTAQRPDVLATPGQAELFKEALEASGYKVRINANAPDDDASPAPEM